MKTHEEKILNALLEAGIENWAGYHEALKIVNENLEEGDDPKDPELILGALEAVDLNEWNKYEQVMAEMDGGEEDEFLEEPGEEFYDDDDIEDEDAIYDEDDAEYYGDLGLE